MRITRAQTRRENGIAWFSGMGLFDIRIRSDAPSVMLSLPGAQRMGRVARSAGWGLSPRDVLPWGETPPVSKLAERSL